MRPPRAIRALGRRLNAAPVRENSARARGLHPKHFAPWGSWSPVGTVQDRPSRQARRSLSLVLIKRIAYVRAGGWPSEASVKFFAVRPQDVLAFFSKKLRPCPYRRAAQERKLGKQRSVFPGRRSASAVNSRLGVLVPSGDRPGPTEPAGETLAVARAHREDSARARRGRVALPHPFQTEKRTSKLFRVSFLFGAKKIVPFNFSSGRRCAIVSL